MLSFGYYNTTTTVMYICCIANLVPNVRGLLCIVDVLETNFPSEKLAYISDSIDAFVGSVGISPVWARSSIALCAHTWTDEKSWGWVG